MTLCFVSFSWKYEIVIRFFGCSRFRDLVLVILSYISCVGCRHCVCMSPYWWGLWWHFTDWFYRLDVVPNVNDIPRDFVFWRMEKIVTQFSYYFFCTFPTKSKINCVMRRLFCFVEAEYISFFLVIDISCFVAKHIHTYTRVQHSSCENRVGSKLQ
jgi:hypothetical protein